MKDSEENKDGQERGEELSAVRRQCVPLVCAMLLRIYSAMEMTRDSCDLCSIIASEDRQLYLVSIYLLLAPRSTVDEMFS